MFYNLTSIFAVLSISCVTLAQPTQNSDSNLLCYKSAINYLVKDFQSKGLDISDGNTSHFSISIDLVNADTASSKNSAILNYTIRKNETELFGGLLYAEKNKQSNCLISSRAHHDIKVTLQESEK